MIISRQTIISIALASSLGASCLIATPAIASNPNNGDTTSIQLMRQQVALLTKQTELLQHQNELIAQLAMESHTQTQSILKIQYDQDKILQGARTGGFYR